MAGDDPRNKNSDDDPNVVSLADVRKRQRTVRADKDAGKAGDRKADGRFGARQANGRPNGYGARKVAEKGPAPLKKVLQYVQFILFLAVVAYFMSLCKGPSH